MFKKTNMTRTDLDILNFLCQHPDREYHVRALAKEAGISTGASSEGLRRLEKKGLVGRVTKGKMKFYRLLDEKPAVKAYKKALTLISLEPVVMALRELTRRIILFGSAAEGTETSESDIDLLIVTANEARVRKLLRGFKTINGHRLSPVVLSPDGLVKLSREDKAFHARAMGGIPLWRDRDE